MNDEAYMRLALAQAERASALGEVPVGAIVVLNEDVIGVGFNQPISSADPAAHAEIMALRAAAKKLANYRLVGCELYVTIEPCTMCVGAIIHSRIDRVIYGAPEPKAGALGSAIDLLGCSHFNHRPTVEAGILADDASSLMTEFFQQRRAAKKAQKRSVGDD